MSKSIYDFNQRIIAGSEGEAVIFSQVLVMRSARFACIPLPDCLWEFNFFKGEGHKRALEKARGGRIFTDYCPA